MPFCTMPDISLPVPGLAVGYGMNGASDSCKSLIDSLIHHSQSCSDDVTEYMKFFILYIGVS